MDTLIENCCRVCLEVSDTMLSIDEQIHKFHKTMHELLIQCINFEVKIEYFAYFFFCNF